MVLLILAKACSMTSLQSTSACGCSCHLSLLFCLTTHTCCLSILLLRLSVPKCCLSVGGRIEGDVRINGHPKEQDSFARVSGYVEQFDTHSAAATVHEALMFSGILRNEKDIDHDTTEAFVEQVCHHDHPAFSSFLPSFLLFLLCFLPSVLLPSLLPAWLPLPACLPAFPPSFSFLSLPPSLPFFLSAFLPFDLLSFLTSSASCYARLICHVTSCQLCCTS